MVDIEQQATAAAPAKLVQEIDLAPIVAGIDQVTRGVFDQNRPKQPVLHAADFGCEMVEGRTAVRDRPQVGKLIVGPDAPAQIDPKRVVWGKSVSIRLNLGGR